MKLWNISNKRIKQLYNSKIYYIESNSIVDYNDDLAVFLLSKRELVGQGLIQVKEGVSKSDLYKEGRKKIFNRANLLYDDYQRHCEEREAIKLQPLKPHEEIVEYKKVVDEYNDWVENGSLIPEDIEQVIEEKIYACPYCEKEFNQKSVSLEHLKTHQIEEKEHVDAGAVSNTSPGEGG